MENKNMKIKETDGVDEDGNCTLEVGDLVRINDENDLQVYQAIITKVYPEENDVVPGDPGYEIKTPDFTLFYVRPDFPIKILARVNL